MQSCEKSPLRLPHGFADLEPFVPDWALQTEAERTAKRHNTEMEDIAAFYDLLVARIDEVLESLKNCHLDEMTDEERRLYFLTLSLCEIAPAVELYGQREVIDGFCRTRFPRVDIANMTPAEI